MQCVKVDMDVAKVLAEIEEHCVEVLGERDGPRIAALARRGYRIAPAGAGSTPAGQCRLGGSALLEPGTEWPRVEGVPLNLMAVLDVDVLAPWLGEDLPPSTGLLNFFYFDPDLPYDEYRHIDVFGDSRCWRVIAADPQRAVETPAPAPAQIFDLRPIVAAPIIGLPENDGPIVRRLLDHDDEHGLPPWLRASDLDDEWRSGGDHRAYAWNRHDRAFGWPWALQGGFMREDEVHLLQLDSDDQWQFGDFGLIYYVIPADALRAGDFSRVRVEMQCH